MPEDIPQHLLEQIATELEPCPHCGRYARIKDIAHKHGWSVSKTSRVVGGKHGASSRLSLIQADRARQRP